MTTCPNFTINWDHPPWVWWTLGIGIFALVVLVAWSWHTISAQDRRDHEELERALARHDWEPGEDPS